MGEDSQNSNSSRPDGGRPRSEFQEAVDRLERAVQDLVGSASNEFSDRASTFVDDLTSKIQSEFKSSQGSAGTGQGSPGHDEDYYYPTSARERMQQRRRARRAARRQRFEGPRSRTARLYRDPAQQKIVGVCAGIARYYGVETWVVRCIAVTGLLFLPSIVFPAYWVAYFVLDTPPEDDRKQRRSSSRDHTTSTPELGPAIAPRQSLRNVTADLTEVELRLRRMESHVTSGQYELQRELNKIDTGRNGSGSSDAGQR